MYNSVYTYLIWKREDLIRAPYKSGEYLSYDFVSQTTEGLIFRQRFINNCLFHPRSYSLPIYIFQDFCDKEDNPIKAFASVLYGCIQAYKQSMMDCTQRKRIEYEQFIRDCIQILMVLKEDFCGMDAPLYTVQDLAFFDAENAVDTPKNQPDDKVTDPETWHYFPNSFIKERLAHPEIKLEEPECVTIEVRDWRSSFDVERLDLAECDSVILFTPKAYENFRANIVNSKKIENPSIIKRVDVPEESKSAYITTEVISYKVTTCNDFVYHDESYFSLAFDIFKGNVRLLSATLSKDRFDISLYQHHDMGGFDYRTENAKQNSVIVYK